MTDFGYAQSANLPSVIWNYAPFLLQETRRDDLNVAANDHIFSVDFDGDLNASNNRSNAINLNIVDGRPTVYYSAVETQQYFFLGYYFYHPNDPGPTLFNGLYDTEGHDSDMEGVFLAVQKDDRTPFGRVLVVLSEAHGALIPYRRATLTGVTPYGGDWQGLEQFWPDARQTYNRFVAIARYHTHGTYAAQDAGNLCSDPYTIDFGFGIDVLSVANHGAYIPCVHDDADAMMYAPEDALSPAVRVPSNEHNDIWYYRLAALDTSVVWRYRLTPGALFEGPMIDLGFGQQGLSRFPSTTSNHSIPPWMWRGGPGENVAGHYWYSFATDSYASWWQSRKDWPYLPNGKLLLDPAGALAMRFSGLSGLDAATVYNPYRGSPPPLPHLPLLRLRRQFLSPRTFVPE